MDSRVNCKFVPNSESRCKSQERCCLGMQGTLAALGGRTDQLPPKFPRRFFVAVASGPLLVRCRCDSLLPPPGPHSGWSCSINMPKVISYTPPWLSRPSPGASLFADTAPKTAEKTQKLRKELDYTGPSRTLAQRGNEVFAVVDNQIRWSNLTRVKDEWKQKSSDASRNVQYRVWAVVSDLSELDHTNSDDDSRSCRCLSTRPFASSFPPRTACF